MSTTQAVVPIVNGLNALRPRILHTAYFVADIARALAFYEGVLGMKEQQRFDLDAGVKEAILGFPDSKGAGVILMWDTARSTKRTKGEGYSRFVMMVSDLDAALAHLRANAVAVTKTITEVGTMRYLMIEDPDGYTIEVLQIRQ